MGDNKNNMENIADYLAQLLKDKKQLGAFPNVFIHIERLLDDEIGKVRNSLFQINGIKKEPLLLPEPEGPIISLSEKVYVPTKDHPDYNFVGRILGPRGMTAKQLEKETGCKIMVRGKGSTRDKKKEDMNRGKANWEHLNDELHVLITVEDTANRAHIKMQRAKEEIDKLLVPVTDGEDELKKRQLMELAIINGTYRDTKPAAGSFMISSSGDTLFQAPGFYYDSSHKLDLHKNFQGLEPAAARLFAPQLAALSGPIRAQAAPLGAPLILSPRLPLPAALLNGSAPPPLIAPGDATTAGLLYSAYDCHQYAAALASPLLAEYPPAASAGDHAGAIAKARRRLNLREHPYQRTAGVGSTTASLVSSATSNTNPTSATIALE